LFERNLGSLRAGGEDTWVSDVNVNGYVAQQDIERLIMRRTPTRESTIEKGADYSRAEREQPDWDALWRGKRTRNTPSPPVRNRRVPLVSMH